MDVRRSARAPSPVGRSSLPRPTRGIHPANAAARCAFSSVLLSARETRCARSQQIVLAESITYALNPAPVLYTVHRGESALVTNRIWLHSVSRVGQPQPPVSGVPASPAANRRILASFRHPGKAASVSQRLSPAQSLSGSRMSLSVCILTVLHGEVLYFQHRQPYFGPPPDRVTHLAKKPLPMRHPTAGHHRNSLKKRSLKPHLYELHTRTDASRSGEAAPPKTVNHPCSRNRNMNLILLEP